MHKLTVAALLLAACATAPPSTLPKVDATRCEDAVSDPRVVPPKVVSRAAPRLNRLDAQGTVTLDLLVNTKGEVEGICSEEGPDELVVAAVDAVKRWQFEPATLDGKPVPFRFHFTTRFNAP